MKERKHFCYRPLGADVKTLRLLSLRLKSIKGSFPFPNFSTLIYHYTDRILWISEVVGFFFDKIQKRIVEIMRKIVNIYFKLISQGNRCGEKLRHYCCPFTEFHFALLNIYLRLTYCIIFPFKAILLKRYINYVKVVIFGAVTATRQSFI